MHRKSLVIPLLLASAAAARAAGGNGPAPDTEMADTVIVVDKVQVTAIKQGLVLRSQPVAASIVGSRAIERGRIGAVKNLSQTVPNFHAPDYGSRMTSSIYVRGLGARIDQPVIGLNIDNVPVLNKDNFDTELADAERIEVLRGPQSTLYGRNTMGGVVNVYTLSPLTYEGVRLMAEYGSGDSYRFRASSYYKLAPDLGMAVTGYYTHTGGFFENQCTGEKCDRERLGGGRWKLQWCASTTRSRSRCWTRGAIPMPTSARTSCATAKPSSATGRSPTTTPRPTAARPSATGLPCATTPKSTPSRRSPRTSIPTTR